MTETDLLRQTIGRQLFECAAAAGNSEHKRARFIELPRLVLEQATAIAEGRYRPQPFTVFAVTDPKLREIFAPDFADRLVQQWLVRHIEPWWDKRFIDDSYANRKGKGTLAAIDRLQHFMRQPHRRWYIKLDVRAFFPGIDRRIVLDLWRAALPRLPHPEKMRRCLDQVASAILQQNPVEPLPMFSGQRHLLAQIPAHKSLYHAAPGKGMPIGSLTSQFFANVCLNELDQFVKHTLKARSYVRYVDDAGIQIADAVLERLAEFSTEGETGSMSPACWKTKNRGKVSILLAAIGSTYSPALAWRNPAENSA